MKKRTFQIITLDQHGNPCDHYGCSANSLKEAKEYAHRWMTGKLDGNSWPFGWTVTEVIPDERV